ncbi:10006_t:CDS:2 [Gigaspora rosea]|nr:10006_t:CDS:2 [Gigaspora rosea]
MSNVEQKSSADEYEQEMSTVEQESSADEHKQEMSDIEQESKPQEASENISDNELTDSNLVSSSKLTKNLASSSESTKNSVSSNHMTIHLPPGFPKALRLLEIKAHSNMMNEMYLSIDPIWIDCCVKSCCAFTENLKDLQECPICGENRYKRNSKKELVEEGHFTGYWDIALTASLNSYNIFKQKSDYCWIILFINANIQPEDRVKRNNLLIRALIPGPSVPGNLNSFLRLVIDELKKLELESSTNCSVVSWSGDTPALAKLMCTTGYNSYQGYYMFKHWYGSFYSNNSSLNTNEYMFKKVSGLQLKKLWNRIKNQCHYTLAGLQEILLITMMDLRQKNEQIG